MDALDSLGDDLVLLSVSPADGRVTTAQAALAGLAHATGLGTVLYRGRDGRPARARLERIAKGDQVAMAVPDGGSASGDGDATSAAVHAATQAAHRPRTAPTAVAADTATDHRSRMTQCGRDWKGPFRLEYTGPPR